MASSSSGQPPDFPASRSPGCSPPPDPDRCRSIASNCKYCVGTSWYICLELSEGYRCLSWCGLAIPDHAHQKPLSWLWRHLQVQLHGSVRVTPLTVSAGFLLPQYSRIWRSSGGSALHDPPAISSSWRSIVDHGSVLGRTSKQEGRSWGKRSLDPAKSNASNPRCNSFFQLFLCMIWLTHEPDRLPYSNKLCNVKDVFEQAGLKGCFSGTTWTRMNSLSVSTQKSLDWFVLFRHPTKLWLPFDWDCWCEWLIGCTIAFPIIRDKDLFKGMLKTSC